MLRPLCDPAGVGRGTLERQSVAHGTTLTRMRLIATRQGCGLTETSPAAYDRPPGAERDGMTGVLVPGTECRIVCIETGRVLERHKPGEVLIRGPRVMKGYWNNPEATAATIERERAGQRAAPA